MSASRQAWLAALDRHICHFDAPAGGPLWCPEYDRITPERLRRLHWEKLPLAVRYIYDSSAMYRRKLEETGTDPASIRSVDDLDRLPIVTKEDMSAAGGGYLAVDEQYWDSHGWVRDLRGPEPHSAPVNRQRAGAQLASFRSLWTAARTSSTWLSSCSSM